MTSKLILAAGLVSLAAALMPAANAAPGGVVEAGDGQVQTRSHNHMKEKTGIAPTARGKAAPETVAAKPRHEHRKFHK